VNAFIHKYIQHGLLQITSSLGIIIRVGKVKRSRIEGMFLVNLFNYLVNLHILFKVEHLIISF
jgi:hypothetical protein